MALGQYYIGHSSLDPFMLFRRLSPPLSAIGYRFQAVALVGTVSNQAVIMVCLDLLMSSVFTVWNGKIHFAHCHHYYNGIGAAEWKNQMV
uniref:Uncharacterized protein n=1 Tax=Ditylenchus dipsaci TaxID=166011 RepID=A0A915CP25_9BILA